MSTVLTTKLLKTTWKQIGILAMNDITTVEDLLRYFPRTYEDRTQIKTIDQVTFDWTSQVIKWRVTKKGMIRTPTGKTLIEMQFVDKYDNQWVLHALNNTFLLRTTQQWSRYYIIWTPKDTPWTVDIWYPKLIAAPSDESIGSPEVGRIVPIYSEMQGIKPSWFTKKIDALLQDWYTLVSHWLPSSIIEQFTLSDRPQLLYQLHAPQSIEEIKHAKRTLFFLQMLRIQLQGLNTRDEYITTTQKEQPDRDHIKTFLDRLPFELTTAQKRVIKESLEDMLDGDAMLRLLQWDVGSGKTIVAATLARYVITKMNWQVAFLAPLEVLAQQHHKSLAKLLLPLWIRIELLTWSVKASEKQRIKQSLARGHIDLIVGTHAIIQDDVQFDDLQFAVIDEQHKFGVKQRAKLASHGSPHLLQMTATPIPRSLALTYFGEFDVSIIDEMPAGRKPITTKIITEDKFVQLKPWIMTKIGQWQKVFLITPLIDESEVMEDVKAATMHYQDLCNQYPEIQQKIGLLHGRLKSAEKDQIMADFKSWKYVMLVSTTVIEVGIDIPEATVMIIYNADRFGLSQLHQLRWRVWRSDLQSYCFLETSKKSWDTYQRLKHMETVTDGFKLSEIDLKYRGPGEFMGTRQAGETDLPLWVLTNEAFVVEVRQASELLWNEWRKEAQEFISQDDRAMIVA